jgi:hypothetical protein
VAGADGRGELTVPCGWYVIEHGGIRFALPPNIKSRDRRVTLVNCRTHGLQQQTMVCQHVVAGLMERRRVGFFWNAEDPTNPRPDAWCSECDVAVQATAGEWIDAALELAQPKVLCGACYDTAKVFHMGGNPWS